jgi:hypothetical protein
VLIINLRQQGKYKNYFGLTFSHLMELLDKSSTQEMNKKKNFLTWSFCQLVIREKVYDEKDTLFLINLKRNISLETIYPSSEFEKTVEKCR